MQCQLLYAALCKTLTLCQLAAGLCCNKSKPNMRNIKYESSTSKEKTGPIENKTITILRNVFTFSTNSVVKEPPYLSLAKSILDDMQLSE